MPFRQILSNSRLSRCALISIFPAAVLAASLGGCKEEANPAAMQERPPAAVTTATAIAQDVPMYLDEIGRTVAVQVVTVVPQVDGKIIATHVEDGQEVRKGDLLFEIDPRPFEAAVASAKALLAQRQAELALAKTEFDRAAELLPKKAVSQLEFDRRKSELAVAEAQILAAESQLRTAELDLEYTRILAPITGRAGARLVDAGNIVRANDQALLVLQQLDPIYAEFTITENDLGTVRKFIASRGMEWGDSPGEGLPVLVDVPGDSARILTALGGPAMPQPTTAPATTEPTTRSVTGPRTGTLTFLDNSVQNATGTIRLRAVLDNADRFFWPGQFVNVRLVLATRKNAVLIPVVAQQIGQQGPYVYVVTQGEVTNPVTQEKKPATVAELRQIRLGQRHGDMVVVESGLEAGEQVVTVGHMMIQPGGPVAVTNPPETPETQDTHATAR